MNAHGSKGERSGQIRALRVFVSRFTAGEATGRHPDREPSRRREHSTFLSQCRMAITLLCFNKDLRRWLMRPFLNKNYEWVSPTFWYRV
jgi:hypothetical protein